MLIFHVKPENSISEPCACFESLFEYNNQKTDGFLFGLLVNLEGGKAHGRG